MAEQYKLIHPVKYYRDYLNNNIRPDGREFDKFRPVALNVGSITSADGSAIVKIGDTSVVCGIRAELAKPDARKPNEGYLVPNFELTSICSKKYRDIGINSRTKEDSEALTCAIHDILTNANCIDLTELCIHKERLVWSIYCDIVCLNHDGSLIDAALIATIAALKNLKLPKVIYTADIDKIEVDIEVKKSINVRSIPIATTLMIFDDNILITDPTEEEENLSSSTITIAVCNADLCFILKPGGTPFSQQQMDICTKQALTREKLILSLINNTNEYSTQI